MPEPTKEHALNLFRTTVCDRHKEVDPNEEHDWFVLSLGFFLAIGCSIDAAYDYATESRYEHGYWMPQDESTN